VIFVENRDFFHTAPAFDALVRGFSAEYFHYVWWGTTKVVDLPDGGKMLRIYVFVSIQYMNVTDRHHTTA